MTVRALTADGRGRIWRWGAVVLVALALGASMGCGKKGKLDRPPGSEPSYPRSYPDARP